jgi:hypothetical protein
MECLKIRKNSFGFRPLDVQVMMPITDRDRHDPVDAMIGVFPFGAQVRRTVAFWEMPDSSQNASFAPTLLAFF